MLVFGLATVLTGCSDAPMFDRLPTNLGGLPASTPARPTTPYQYPAVHDMPPARPTKTLSEDEQLRMEKELMAIRNRQAGPPAADKKATPAAKKKPSAVIIVPPAGAKINP